MVTSEELEGQTQKMLGSKIDQCNLSTLTEDINRKSNTKEMARLLFLGLPYAGAWLAATPVASLSLYLHSSEFVMAAKYRLGCQIYDKTGPCPSCLKPSDQLGDHSLCCG